MNDEGERQRRFRDADEQNTARRAGVLGVKYLDLRGYETALPLLNDTLSIADMYQFRIVPLFLDKNINRTVYGITLSTPETEVKKLRDEAVDGAQIVEFNMISDSSWRAMMARYDPPKDVVYDNVEIAKEGDSETMDKVSDELDAVRPDDIMNYLILQAFNLGASDIHIENQREAVRIRFRIDGTLHPIANISHEKYRIVFSSIASSADLSTAAQESQSGHMIRNISELGKNFKLGNNLIGDANSSNSTDQNDVVLNMRIETVPTAYGQDAVIRLFNFDSEMLNMDSLGMSEDEKSSLNEIINKPTGMLMIVGPTGSGKSTTLYSVLEALNSPSRKILTLEDPIEFDIPGVVQVPVDTTHGHKFADELRTVLRLDPDVVMVGEIRDNDTAKTAIQAAITGHLLLATFHAEDAAAAFSRIIDMIGINPVFAGAIRMVIGQRLVRKLSPESKIAYDPSDAEKRFIREKLKDLPDEILHRELGEDFDLKNYKLYKPGKTEKDPFGYRGRTVLMEELKVSEEIAKFLTGDAKDVSAKVIRETAARDGMITMIQKGVLKVLRGETTLEEINRVL